MFVTFSLVHPILPASQAWGSPVGDPQLLANIRLGSKRIVRDKHSSFLASSWVTKKFYNNLRLFILFHDLKFVDRLKKKLSKGENFQSSSIP